MVNEMKSTQEEDIKNGMIQTKGKKSWYINNKLHREDGPAVERTDGIHDWYLDGKNVGMCIDNSDGTRTYYLGRQTVTEKEFKATILKDYLNSKLDNKPSQFKLKI